jgi:DNA polymerase epsilon subunit 2
LFTDGAFAIVEGTFGEDHIFHVSEINLPPAEARDMTE